MSEATPPDWAKFQVGQRVWCVRAAKCFGGEVVPTVGEIYTIRELGVIQYSKARGLLDTAGAKFCEITNPPRIYVGFSTPDEPFYPLHGFRPLREQNIEVFRQMCIKSPKQNTKELETVR